MIQTLYVNLVVPLIWQTIALEVSYNRWNELNAKELMGKLNLPFNSWLKKTSPFKRSSTLLDMAYQVISLSTLIRHPFFTCTLEIYIYRVRGKKNVRINGVDDKMTGKFLPIQLMFTGKTKRCLPNVKFPHSFYVTHTKKHWWNQLKDNERFKRVTFPYLDRMKENTGYSKEKMGQAHPTYYVNPT